MTTSNFIGIIVTITLWAAMIIVQIDRIGDTLVRIEYAMTTEEISIDSQLRTLAGDYTTPPTYHVIDKAGLKTFSPQPNIICYWIDKTTEYYNGKRHYVNASGLSCVPVSDSAYESYLDRYPR